MMRTSHRAVVSALVVAAGALLVMPASVHAQDSHWGVSATFVPTWDPVPEIYELLYDVNTVDGEGKEFRIGVARGRDLGGDWSVSFVRSRINPGTVFDEFQPFTDTDPTPIGTIYVARSDLRIDGIKADVFLPFATIKERVQIGMALGGGVGWLKGTVEEHTIRPDVDFDPVTNQVFVSSTTETVEIIDVKEENDFTTIPLGSVEVAVAVIAAPGFKIRFSGGFNFPNTQRFSITANYLIGG